MATILQEDATVNAKLGLFFYLTFYICNIDQRIVIFFFFFFFYKNYYFDASSSQDLFNILYLIIPPPTPRPIPRNEAMNCTPLPPPPPPPPPNEASNFASMPRPSEACFVPLKISRRLQICVLRGLTGM